MSLVYRSLRETEVPEAVGVFLAGLTDYTRRHGLPAPLAYTPSAVQPLYQHLFTTGIFEVAEEAGRLVTIASGIVRDSLFFLSMFWSLPEYRERGIGKPLLRRVHEEASRRGAISSATWSSLEFAAMGTYLKLGMLPRGPILTFAGAPTRIPVATTDVRIRPLEAATACQVDRTVRGTARPVDHAYFSASGARGFECLSGKELAGYFYVKGGVIGPAAWTDDAHGDTVLSAAFTEARTGSPEIKLIVLSSNEAALRAAVGAELKIVGSAHWFTSAPFGALDRYVPSGPGVF